MRHPDDLLSAYVDGALPAEAATEVAAHLAECRTCRRLLSDLQAVRELLARARTPEPPPELLAGILRSTDQTASAGRPRWHWLPALAAALLLVAGLRSGRFPALAPSAAPLVEELRQHARLAARMPWGEPASLLIALQEEPEP